MAGPVLTTKKMRWIGDGTTLLPPKLNLDFSRATRARCWRDYMANGDKGATTIFRGMVRRLSVRASQLSFSYTTAMEITLTPNGEGLLRAALARHPNQSPAEIVELALAERIEREAAIEK